MKPRWGPRHAALQDDTVQDDGCDLEKELKGCLPVQVLEALGVEEHDHEQGAVIGGVGEG